METNKRAVRPNGSLQMVPGGFFVSCVKFLYLLKALEQSELAPQANTDTD